MQLSLFKQTVPVLILLIFLTSCSVSKTIQENADSNSYLNERFEPLKRTEYSILSATTGEAKAKQFYILFFPIGKAKSTKELESNAYHLAVENCPYADAVILPRTIYKRFFIPLLLFNYSSRSITVNGRGIKISEVNTK